MSMQFMMVEDEPEQSIPLPTPEEEQEMSRSSIPDELPILTLRNTVLFPGVVLPITIGRDASLQLVRDAFSGDKLIGVVAQRKSNIENPDPEELHHVGTVATVLRLLKMPDGSKSIVIQGKRRFRIDEFAQHEPYFRARVEPYPETLEEEEEIRLQALIRSIKESAIEIVTLSPNLPSEAAEAIQHIDSPTFLIHFIASNLEIDVTGKQTLLESHSLVDRANLVMEHLSREIQVLEVSEEIRSRVKSDTDEKQREFFLRQQLKAIQEELGEGDGASEVESLRNRAKEKDLPEHAAKTLDDELKKLARSNPAASDYAVTRNYVDWILDLPWREYSEDKLDINSAAGVLDEDHYGLVKVKDRILEYLAVLKLRGDLKAPIICFHGPPGVGKTSLGRSIARALGRKFVRMSLGGIRDEAEIRGHRRTYVGALPGRILQGLKKAGTANPVFMLDEVDKVGADWRGDPSSALLEVLDPEQNFAFNDHYIELDYDLSKILFIATANYLDRIPDPLRDRMEVIHISGYTQYEKLAIANTYLVPRQTERNGLTAEQFTLSDTAIACIIDGYTRESGVRQLERTIASVARGVAKKVAIGEAESATIDAESLEKYLGARKYFSDVAERTEVAGVATGLAWTPTGGDILFVEASVSRGSGQLILTGQLGDVMKESAQAALSYVKSYAGDLDIPLDAFKHWDLHVHVPAGAVPKDGPSAGVALLTAIASIYTQRRVQHDLAMTGEITLRGLVLPVGGIKEKVLAAKRAGITRVVLPAKNEKDIKEIKGDALSGISVTYVKRMGEILRENLESTPMRDATVMFAVADAVSTTSGNRPKSA